MVEPVRDAGRPDPDGFAERIHFRRQNPCNRWQQPILTDDRVSISAAYFCQIPFCDVKTGFGKGFFEFQEGAVLWVEFFDWEGVWRGDGGAREPGTWQRLGVWC